MEITEQIGVLTEMLEGMKGACAEALTLAIETLQKHKDGLCITLPCKVGDTVYVDTRTFMYGDRNGRRHAEGLVTSFVFGHRNFIKFHIFSPYVKHYKVFKYPLSAFGKTVFLTREEAEAALRKEQSDETHD
jgi:DNA-binding Xre family transcriptional regulator